MLSSNLNTPYPPPDLLNPMEEKIQILPSKPQNQTSPEKPETPMAATTDASVTTTAEKQAPNK